MGYFSNELLYYKKLYFLFKQYGFLSDNIESKRHENYIEKYETGKFSEIYHEKCMQYIQCSMDQSACLNYMKFHFWQVSFGIDRGKETLLLLSLDFNLYCVIVDRILDNNIEGFSKQKIWDRLSWDEAKKTFYYGCIRQEEDFLDYLLNRMAIQIRDLALEDKHYWKEICENIKKAFESEIYMSRECFNGKGIPVDMARYMDKSIKFVKVCFQIAGYTGKERSKINICAESVGVLFCLVDDLCDVFEDLRDGFCNSLLICEMENSNNDQEQAILCLTNNLEQYLKKMKTAMDYLRENTNEDFFHFILWELSEWCENVSRRLEK